MTIRSPPVYPLASLGEVGYAVVLGTTFGGRKCSAGRTPQLPHLSRHQLAALWFNCFATAMSASLPAESPLARFARPRFLYAWTLFALNWMAWNQNARDHS